MTLALAMAISLAAAVPASSRAPHRSAPVPQGFVGMNVDGPVFPDTDNHIDLAQQLNAMVASGVETLRIEFDWASAQPYEDWSDVPSAQMNQFVDVGGVPTDFAATDQIVALAAQRGLTILPTVIDAPAWDGAPHKGAVVTMPKSDYWFGNFLTGLVDRYGPNGSFWSDHSPRLPIHMWQIWNEPNITAFWEVQPFEPAYVALLRASREAIKAADPTAKIVLAGMPNFSWIDLERIYKVHGARSLFDVVAIHPYTKQPKGVITILTNVRQVMNRAGDRHKPIIADEVSWPSSQGKTFHNEGFDIGTTQAGQASDIARLLPLLGRFRTRLGLMAFDYYTWAGDEHHNANMFEFAGLFRYSNGRFVTKPAYRAFRRGALALEHCRQKGTVATSCLAPG